MKIYACLPEKLCAESESLRNELHESLTEFYGRFSPSDIEFFTASDDTASIYIMDSALNSYFDSLIVLAIERIINVPVNVKLNYKKLNPNFRPSERKQKAPIKNAEAKENDKASKLEEFDDRKLSLNYHAEDPLYTFDQLILPEKTRRKIYEAINMILPEIKHKVFNEWGLRHIVPHTVSALSFYGPPGTGKSMAAEAIAHKLGKKIIRASYADITSKYFGEGSKMIKAVFHEALCQDAVLFIDEADSLLSKRLNDPSDGSGNAINSMRSQLLIALEQFEGIVIFATNLVVNYDRAFISRLISIEIPPPDFHGRKAIWEQHLTGSGINIPLADDVNIDELARRYDENFYGREIKKAVIRACVSAAISNRDTLTQEDFMTACMNIKTEAADVTRASDYTQSKTILTPSQQKALKNTMQRLIIK